MLVAGYAVVKPRESNFLRQLTPSALMPEADSRLWHWRVGGGRRVLQVYFYSQKVVWQLTDRGKLKQELADLSVRRSRSHLKNQVTSSIVDRFIQGLGVVRHRVDTTI